MKIKPLFKENETPTVLKYLARCGVDSPKNYDNPPASVVESPYKYANMDRGIEILEQAIATVKDNPNKYITIICDSDCDGYCATTIAYKFLTHQGVSTHDIIILFHSGKQHGLSKDILEQLHILLDEEHSDCTGKNKNGTAKTEISSLTACVPLRVCLAK